MHQAAELASRRGLVVILSDLFGDLPALVGGLDHLRYGNHEVLIFQVLDPYERDLSVDGKIRFRDLESGETLTTSAEGVREAYLKAIDDWRQALESECRKRAIDRLELTTLDPPDQAILNYLGQARRRACEPGEKSFMTVSWSIPLIFSLLGQAAPPASPAEAPARPRGGWRSCNGRS